VSVDRKTITFRPNEWRRLKTAGSHRVVRLWPQLEEIRLQTLDRGAAVSTYTVARELGHESEAMVRRVYAHLGEVRHRSEVVEYRVAQHREQVDERLQKLGIVTGNVTADRAGTETPRDNRTVGGADASDSWAWVELNYRPHAYQACALTT
jgi:hypothetical protein